MRCFALALALAFAGAEHVRAAPCDDLDWRSVLAPVTGTRALTADDLVRLRDVGPANNELADLALFTLSPNRTRVAFQIRRADPVTNSYCLGMVVMALDRKSAPIFVDRGGTLLQYSARLSGQGGLDTGIPMVITPRWSPDGSWIAFLKREAGPTRLWRAASNGQGSLAVSPEDWNVLDFRVVDKEHALVRFQDRSLGGPHQQSREAMTGYHFDDRFLPAASNVPVLAPPELAHTALLDMTAGTFDVLSDEDAQTRFGAVVSDPAQSPAGGQVTLVEAGKGVGLPMAISVLRPDHRTVVCSPTVCGDVEREPWWNARHDALLFFRHAGWAGSRTEIAEWRPGAQQVTVRFATSDYLVYCRPRRADLIICLRETAVLPRHLAAIDLRRGKVDILADFNPELAGLTLGQVSRIQLKSAFGIPAYADVVLPVGYTPGRRYPIIVVQYRSRGFLRGGVGDEFPIQAFANEGFAVMSFDRPESVGVMAHPPTWTDVDRLGLADFVDRRNVLSALEQGVRILIDRGIADPKAIGITGLSDGSSTVQFAALNSPMFAAGIVSGCCWEREQDALLGLKGQALYRPIGWPPLTDPAPAFWSRTSLEQNAAHVAFPILFDAADDEFRLALASYVALRESGKPADMFVFPDEHHTKWQPAHRLAAYQRSIDWFDFWLRGRLPDDPDRRKDALRWMDMRDQAVGRATGPSPHAIQ